MLAALGLGAMSGSLHAQTAPGAMDVIAIPADIEILGPAQTAQRSATVKVNGDIITGTDVDHRVALILAANDGTPIADEEMRALRMQVLRNLIDETIQIKEAEAQEMAVTEADVDNTYNRLATQRFGRSPEELDAYLYSVGSSPASLKRQIQGELAWSRLLQRNVEPYVTVSQDEVDELYTRMEESRGTVEYRVGEIYLSATPETRNAVFQNGQRIVDQMRQGGSFVAYARQFSEASTAAVGGDLGWIRIEQLQNPTLETVARDMQPGQLVGPIEIPGGFSILYMIDRRQVGMADPRDAQLSLLQISLDFPAGMPEDQRAARAQQFGQQVQAIPGCGAAQEQATQLGATVVGNDAITARALPEALQGAVLQMQVGQVTPVFGSLDEGVRVLMLCGRTDPEQQGGPTRDQLMGQLMDDRIGKRAQRYMRDLRRDAVIEYN
ncbi:peptidylprolyl isomerase [Paraurantiacibacter namhicola]|uniref:peptidylprolyl isomerase n=1 Tax=Paraurantiacibacter namhicola TaxID=645517 RepID=UPI001EEF4447|nr:peptidylprolyl isomerase [Paraurantiacibacter namhicola]